MKGKNRKANGNSKLDSLPLDKRKELIDGLLCNWTYRQAADWLQAECGESVSISAWTPFFERHVEPIQKEIRQFALLSAQSLEERAKAADVFTQATIAEFKENAYQLMRSPGADPEDKRKWMETLLKEAASNREDIKVSILKAKQADEAKEVTGNQALSPEQKDARLKQIFGMG